MGRLDGRVCLVTGASSGIGAATAKGLAREGATVLCVGRSRERTQAIAASLEAEGGRGEAYLADFSSLAEVASLADRVRADHDALHVLIHNAGLVHGKRERSRDGYEDTFAVNHLAPFLLTARLRALVEASAPSRVITVSSRLHRHAKRFELDDPQLERRRYRPLVVYRHSKLANVIFAYELARRLEGTGVTSNCLHPGDVATNVVRESRFLQWGLDHIAKYFVKSPEEGARTTLRLAADPTLEGVTGRYFRDEREAEPHREAHDREIGARLWALSEEMVEAALGRGPQD